MEKRKHQRRPINIQLTLRELTTSLDTLGLNGIQIPAQATDLSAKGMGFTGNILLKVGTAYSAKIVYQDYNPFIITLRVLNQSLDESGNQKYGCQFEGHHSPLDKTPFFQALYHSLYE